MNPLRPTTPQQRHLRALPKENGTVLVVDDSSDVRSMIGRVLIDWGFSSVTAPDGVIALEHLSQQPIEVMLTDYHMPRLNGLQLLTLVRKYYPAVPVIVISSENCYSLITKAKDIGAFGWITKPFDMNHLRNTVEKAWKDGRPVTKS